MRVDRANENLLGEPIVFQDEAVVLIDNSVTPEISAILEKVFGSIRAAIFSLPPENPPEISISKCNGACQWSR